MGFCKNKKNTKNKNKKQQQQKSRRIKHMGIFLSFFLLHDNVDLYPGYCNGTESCNLALSFHAHILVILVNY